MKVCTDACVLGAWADVGPPNSTSTYLLDIGTGTGLLALMAAQRNPSAVFDAVELDEAAAGQAAENVATSPFADRVRVWQTAIQAYRPPADVPGAVYDHILTNPPFYVNSLRSPSGAVNRALHADELPFADLVAAVARLLKPGGTWSVLLPPPEAVLLNQLAGASGGTAAPADRCGYVPVRQLYLRHQPQKPVFRHLITYRAAEGVSTDLAPLGTLPRTLGTPPDELTIYETDGQTYTDAFRQLLAPFYLNF